MNTTTNPSDGKKWINTGVALASILVGFIFMSFLNQMGIWFELESKIKFFRAYSQGLGVIAGLVSFIAITKHPKTSEFLNEVFAELKKVVWPDKSDTVRHSVGIIIGVTIAGLILGFFDFSASKLLSLLH